MTAQELAHQLILALMPHLNRGIAFHSAHTDGFSAAVVKAVMIAAEIDATQIIVETAYGGDQALLSIRTAWEALRRENPTRFSVFCPSIEVVPGKLVRLGKVLRAEPIAQQWVEDKVRFAQYLPDVEAEWATWQAGSPESPGRIDASCYLAYHLLPIPASGQAKFNQSLLLSQVDLSQSIRPGDMGMLR